MTLAQTHASDPNALKVIFSSLTLICKIFYSLNFQVRMLFWGVNFKSIIGHCFFGTYITIAHESKYNAGRAILLLTTSVVTKPTTCDINIDPLFSYNCTICDILLDDEFQRYVIL